MNFIKVNGEYINLENVYFVNMDEKERIIKISYCLNEKMIEYDIDYSDVKDDINEEKTKIEQDYEKIESFILKKVVPESELEEANNKIKDLEFSRMNYKELKEKYHNKLEEIYKIVFSKKLRKIKRIKEILTNE